MKPPGQVGPSATRWGWSAVLLPAMVILIVVPLLAAFAPVADGGLATNLMRALSDRRFVVSFRYGLGQAAASALLATALGLPGAFLVARRTFAGRRFLLSLGAVPFAVPPLIIAIGFVLYYGRQGVLNRLLVQVLGLDGPPLTFLYSSWGLVLTHGLYNFPLVVRFVADAFATVPRQHEDAARLLGASPTGTFMTITLPSVAPAIGAAVSLVFLFSFFSFVIVLLFGRPGVSTPEVELYRAARFTFDRPLASAYALVETLVAMTALALYARMATQSGSAARREADKRSPTSLRTVPEKVLAAMYVMTMAVLLGGPLLAIVGESFLVPARAHGLAVPGVSNYLKLFGRPTFWMALVNTVILGLSSAALATTTGFAFSVWMKRRAGTALASILPLLPLGVSGVVLAYGWQQVTGTGSFLGLVLVQAVSTYPFTLRAVESAVGMADNRYADAARTLGSSSLEATMRIRLPMALPSVMTGFAMSFAMSAGDATAIIAAPVPGFETLAMLLFRLAGSYRFGEACAAATVLAVLAGTVFLMKGPRDAIA